jgi:hypothetical protein
MYIKKIVPFILFAVLGCITIGVLSCNNTSPKTKHSNTTESVVNEPSGLNRNPTTIHYSKHAKCRMDCRHIDEVEVKDVLKNGNINYKKSELNGDDCHKKYAVEGYSKDGQHLRIIFAPCKEAVNVVTCIDIGAEWECHCEGDHH